MDEKAHPATPRSSIRNWEHLEALVTALQAKFGDRAKVEGNVKIPGQSGLRQIDTLFRATIAGTPVLVIINSKHHGRRVNVNHVGELADVMDDVGATSGIIVSSKGFSKQALRRASARRIDTCLVRPAIDRDWKGLTRSAVISVTAKSIVIDSVELEFDDGERRFVASVDWVEVANGDRVFIDRILERQLESTNTWSEGVVHSYEPTSALFYAPDDEERRRVRFFHAAARHVDGFTVEQEVRAKEDWVYVKVRPDGEGEGTKLFCFAEIDSLVRIETTIRSAAAQVRCAVHGRHPANIRLEWHGTRRAGLLTDRGCCPSLDQAIAPAVDRALKNIGVKIDEITLREQTPDPLKVRTAAAIRSRPKKTKG